jgi:hypothetical protein
MGSWEVYDLKTLAMPESPSAPPSPETKSKSKGLRARDTITSRGRFLLKQPTLQALVPRPWDKDTRCSDVCLSLQHVSRADLIKIGDNRENRQRLRAQLLEGKCSQAPLVTMDLVHTCFETLINMVACMNNAPECVSHEIPMDWDCPGCPENSCDVKQCTRCNKRRCSIRMSDVFPDVCIMCSRPSEKFGQSSPIYGDVQWSRVRLPWVYVFSAFNTLIRLLCLPETRIRFDSLFTVLVACLFLALKTDDGIYCDTVNLTRFVEMADGLFSTEQLQHVIMAVWHALDLVAPNSFDGHIQDDIVTYIFINGYRLEDDSQHRALCLIEKGIVETYFVRDSKQRLASGSALSMSRDTVLMQFEPLLDQSLFLFDMFKSVNLIE